jgi:hypothetical protein
MGGKQSSFKLGVLTNNGKTPVFFSYNESSVNFITSIIEDINTVRLIWAQSPNPVDYRSYTFTGFNIGKYGPSRLEEFDRIRCNYYPRVIRFDKYGMTIGLYTSNLSITDVTWMGMLNTVGLRLDVSCSISISTDEPSSMVKTSIPFDYHTIITPGNIYNNAVYISQDGTTSYLDNTNVDVDSTFSSTFMGLTNDNGYYMVTVVIDKNGLITLDNKYMSYATGTVRIDTTTLLIKTSIVPMKVLLMSNINYNSNPVKNYPIIVESTIDGILCSNIMNGMGFTILACITDK